MNSNGAKNTPRRLPTDSPGQHDPRDFLSGFVSGGVYQADTMNVQATEVSIYDDAVTIELTMGNSGEGIFKKTMVLGHPRPFLKSISIPNQINYTLLRIVSSAAFYDEKNRPPQ